MALDLIQNFVSDQYLKNKLTDFHQILYMNSYWQDLALDIMSFFANMYQSYGPWFTPKFCFRSLSWELFYRIYPNFVCTLMLTWSSLGLFRVIFQNLYQSHGPWFLRQNFISAQYIENNLTEFHQILYMHSYWQDLAWNCYKSFFAHVYQIYGPWCLPNFFHLNINRTNWQIFTKFYICIHIDKI